ncbi:CPBP family intramembrane glutamic endopeptidase [Lactobacillus kalixensis]|uniref:Protease n=1 Tax=Lactobacillus kalixensis DSM 16043 TaxID=1423763 RepID=A0A0R1U3H6_9LACO|nr:protease [Lactobacillus kalixensis DSM 16043]
MVDHLIKQNPASSNILAIIYLLLFLTYLLPVLVVSYGTIQNDYARIIAVILLAIALLASINMDFVTTSELLTHLFRVNIFTGVALIIDGAVLFRRWGFKFKPNLKVKIVGVQIITWILLIAFAFWLPFFNAFSYFANTFEQLFVGWDFSVILPSDYALLASTGAALFEEIERYIILVLLLYAFRNFKIYLGLSIFLSAMQFGLLHFFNLVNTNTSLYDVAVQSSWTFAYGCFLAVLYLYTAQIWLPILSHFSFDFLSYSIRGGGYGFISLYGDPKILCGLMVAAVALIATGLMMWGKRKQVMRENAARLVSR